MTREELYERDPPAAPLMCSNPVNEGSSVGVVIVTADSNMGNPISPDGQRPLAGICRICWPNPSSRAAKLTAAVIDGADGPRALGVTELVIDNGFYDYEHKYTAGQTQHIFPAQLPPENYRLVRSLCGEGASGAGLPRYQPHRFPLGRRSGRSRVVRAGNQHPAGG